MTYVLPFSEIRNTDGARVGGKNASLGEMFNMLAPSGIRIPNGFAITASAYYLFLENNGLTGKLVQSLAKLDKISLANLAVVGAECRALIAAGQLPLAVKREVFAAYARLNPQGTLAVAVRSSAAAEDLLAASFAGQHASFLNVCDADNLLAAIHNCYISLFHDRALKYHIDKRFEPMQVALSVGVQLMVRADLGSAGLALTLDPESGNSNVVYITSAWGLGENIVQGAVNPDEFHVSKSAVGRYPRTLIHRKLGAKETRMIYAGDDGPRPTVNVETSMTERKAFSLTDAEVQTLGEWCCRIELHYGLPMEIEWAKDGASGELFILQARPETVIAPKQALTTKEYQLTTGTPLRTKPLLILSDPGKALKLAGYPSEGVGLLRTEFIISNTVHVHPMALVQYDTLPDGHDKHAIAAITQGYRDKTRYFVETLAEGVALVAAAFHPREVIVRMSDFKTNEYAQLLGGRAFEPVEAYPMLGLRGASRYCHPCYREGFGLECAAMRIVRDEMGLTNVKLMIPFCRTVKEGRNVLETMADFGLVRSKNGLEVYVMAELPSNVILAREFANLFDGFSIGSNDLTQLTLGIDRDSAIISDLFSANNPAVLTLLSMIITDAHEAGVKIGLCGQAPSDFPEFAQYLVQAGIDSIAFNADALLKGIENIRAAELKIPTLG